MRLRRNHLLVLAALIWGVPGVSVTLKGATAYRSVASADVWWLLLVTAAVCAGFYVIFRRIVARYTERILTLPPKVNPLMTFPAHGWAIILFMIGLGLFLKHLPGVPLQFTASFYSGLGPMLLLSAAKFLRAGCHRF